MPRKLSAQSRRPAAVVIPRVRADDAWCRAPLLKAARKAYPAARRAYRQVGKKARSPLPCLLAWYFRRALGKYLFPCGVAHRDGCCHIKTYRYRARNTSLPPIRMLIVVRGRVAFQVPC